MALNILNRLTNSIEARAFPVHADATEAAWVRLLQGL
jgi:hypothetical protein